ncbi:multimerin-1 isoform X2 [Lissotriton helveticus]
MNVLELVLVLSQCWYGSTQHVTAGIPWGEHTYRESGILGLNHAGTNEAQSAKPTQEDTTDPKVGTFSLPSVDAAEPQSTDPIVTPIDSAKGRLNVVPTDKAVTGEPEMPERSTHEGIFAKPQTQESPAVLEDLTAALEAKSTITASAPPETTPAPIIPDADAKTRNRSSRQTIYSNGIQQVGFKKGIFETTRGKNWCAYVHTRLSPNVVADNVETFITAVKDPCTAKFGGCPIRYRMVTRPAYRMKHKIVTSLEWKCCPGYSGERCQIAVLKYQLQSYDNQAESTNAINGGTSADPQQTSLDPALTQKMTNQIYEQEMKLTSLQKKFDNISSTMKEVHSAVSSLEEKINEDNPGKSVQSLLKGLKSKSITELVKETVREQMKGFQNDMQETFAQLFKTISSLSVEVESTNEALKHLNETVASVSATQKLINDHEPRPTMSDMLELKNHLVSVKDEVTSLCSSSLKDLQESHKSLAAELEREQSRNNIYYESLNKTLTKMRDVQEQIISEEPAPVPNFSETDGSKDDNVTDYLLTLQEKVKRQSLMMLQLYEDISAQDIKINNFTITLELQKDSIQRACEARFFKCRKDFESKIRSTEETVLELNKTMSDVVLPLDDKIDKMNEQINDLCYDMEILQPLIEQGAPFSMTEDYGHQNGVSAVNKQIEDLSALAYSLSSSVQDLVSGQESLRTQIQTRDELYEKRIASCLMDIEDGLNNTMTVLNNAVDFIQDNYVTKEAMPKMQNNSQILNQTMYMLDNLFLLIPQVNQLNESIQMLTNGKLQKPTNVNSADSLSFESPKLVDLFQTLNETVVKVDQCHENVSQLEQNLWFANQEKNAYEVRLQNVESKITQIIVNSAMPVKAKNGGIVKEKEQPAYPKYQELNSRVKALEAKSIRISTSIPTLNKTVYETQELCQNAFATIQSLNASVPLLVRKVQPNITILQEVMIELIKTATDRSAEAIWSNLTASFNKSTSEIIGNVTKLQKQMKLVLKKTVLPKTASTNVTAALVGRSQRNTDNTAEQDDSLSCSTSPCHNGGTCINDRDSFVCACRHPFGGANCSVKMEDENTLAPDFSKGSYRYAPMVTFFVSHTYGMTVPGPIKFNNLYVNYGASYAPRSGKFIVPYLGVYVFKYTIESFSPRVSGYLVVDGIDKLAFQSENINNSLYSDRVITGDALLELNYGQEVWLRLATGSIPAKYPPITTFGGFLLYRT